MIYIMGTVLTKKRKAFSLRIKGKSYKEIMKALNISSKGTLSYWFKDLSLSAKAKQRLQSKMRLANERGLLRFNKKRTDRIIKENSLILNRSSNAIGEISKRELLLLGTALYWGEGITREPLRGYQRVGFSNSNPEMVKIFMRYIREILKVDNDDIHAEVYIHPNISADRAKHFWLKTTKVLNNKISIFRSVSGASKFKRPKNFLPHGTINIRIYKRRLFYTIKGFISGIRQSLIGDSY